MAGELQYRPFPYDDWGMIRNADGSMFATVSRPEAYKGEFEQHREEETDPFAELARRVIFFEALERENATLRAERDEARKAKEAEHQQFLQMGSKYVQKCFDLANVREAVAEEAAQIADNYLPRTFDSTAIAAAIRNMGGGENG